MKQIRNNLPGLLPLLPFLKQQPFLHLINKHNDIVLLDVLDVIRGEFPDDFGVGEDEGCTDGHHADDYLEEGVLFGFDEVFTEAVAVEPGAALVLGERRGEGAVDEGDVVVAEDAHHFEVEDEGADEEEVDDAQEKEEEGEEDELWD